MRKVISIILLSVFILSVPVQASTEYKCIKQYQDKIETFYPKESVENDEGWVYKLKGFYWLSKVIGKPAAAFIVAFVPGSIPVVLSISTVAAFFDLLKNEKGIIGAYIVLKMSEVEEHEFANQDIDSKIEEEVLQLQENKYKREENLFNTFVERVNRKYKNTDFSYEQVRRAVVEIASNDDQLCQRKGKEKFTSLYRLIRLTKKRLIYK
ncbi:hypothetical protein BALOs_2195 [Halobacteriovorax sp. BALOs_7]|uniref:hypothetical protein n=1 Tax=Halobacteriovorax sp. BALOs_7 TaxID=2109558 RepID=UPI000EA1F994|nr:hypothetical protein [Halobacteriovorax sp. BALOs_7]AYF45193.1 hypothetical protein BALOs_2195 [Halobacteriovorax sp. BALOs_7]